MTRPSSSGAGDAPPHEARGGGASDHLRRRLAEATAGLVYSSESDRPVDIFFRAAGDVPGAPLDPGTFGTLVDAAPDDIVEEQSPEAFFRRHIEMADPADAVAWQQVRRYDFLRKLLREELRDVRSFRVGRVQVRCYVIGRDAAGNVVGIQTVSVET